jgi:hypothetical protein
LRRLQALVIADIAAPIDGDSGSQIASYRAEASVEK